MLQILTTGYVSWQWLEIVLAVREKSGNLFLPNPWQPCNCKTRWETFMFWDWVPLISEVWQLHTVETLVLQYTMDAISTMHVAPLVVCVDSLMEYCCHMLIITLSVTIISHTHQHVQHTGCTGYSALLSVCVDVPIDCQFFQCYTQQAKISTCWLPHWIWCMIIIIVCVDSLMDCCCHKLPVPSSVTGIRRTHPHVGCPTPSACLLTQWSPCWGIIAKRTL